MAESPATVGSLVTHVLANEVTISDMTVVIDMDLMREQFGPPRCRHPIHEALDGWLDYLDGRWAWSRDGGTRHFWFSLERDMVQFMLMYGGTASLKHPVRSLLLSPGGRWRI